MTRRVLTSLLTVLILVSCHSVKNWKPIANCRSSEECINPIVDYINLEVDGVNQLNIDQWATFRPDSNILIIYIGKSEMDYFQKWEIPLKYVDPNSINMDHTELSGHPLYFSSVNDQLLFRHYANNEFKSNTKQFSYYPGARNGSKSKFRRQFTESFRSAVERSKNAP